MATKRRKVWVNCYEGAVPRAHPTRTSAVTSIGSHGRPICLVERLPGDVVLSREDVEELTRIVDELVERGLHKRALTLLRGRR